MRRIAFVACTFGAALATAVACGFPDIDFAPDTQFVDGSFVADAALGDGGRLPDGGDPDAFVCLGDPNCDCDDDKDPAIACDGGDCDDHDPRVNSKVADFIGDGGDKDFNCDGRKELEFEKDGGGGFQCTDVLDGGPILPAEAKTACDNGRGFTAPLGCGESGSYVQCQRPTFDAKECNIARQETRVRGCR